MLGTSADLPAGSDSAVEALRAAVGSQAEVGRGRSNVLPFNFRPLKCPLFYPLKIQRCILSLAATNQPPELAALELGP
jgi:hypothetical protein